MNPITSSRELELALIASDIPVADWGQGVAKSVADLWLELQNGETTLSFSTEDGSILYRQTQVVELLIQRGDETLIEAMQELGSGERRYRNRLPSEKIKADETPFFAARRCLHEEFSLAEVQLEAIQITIEQPVVQPVDLVDEKLHSSPSYPGLNTLYTVHRARIVGCDFPAHDFATENRAHAEGDPVKAHHWHWAKEWAK